MLKLYEFPEQYEQLYRRLADQDGEMTPADLAELHQIDGDLRTKVANVCSLVRQADAEADMIGGQMDFLSRLHARRERLSDWLKSYLMGIMEQLAVKKIETGRPGLNARIQKNSRPSIQVREGENIPLAYQRVTVALDGQKAYEDWKEGKTLPPALEVKIGSHLRLS